MSTSERSGRNQADHDSQDEQERPASRESLNKNRNAERVAGDDLRRKLANESSTKVLTDRLRSR